MAVDGALLCVCVYTLNTAHTHTALPFWRGPTSFSGGAISGIEM